MMDKIIKKLNNFRFTALIAFATSAVAIIYALGSFVCYHFTGEIEDNVRKVGFTNTLNERYIGMVFFFLVVFAIALAIFVAYSCVPFIKNKEKLVPQKSILLVGFIGSVFQLGVVVLMIVLLVKENPLSKVGIIVSLPFGIVAALTSGLFLFPFIKCNFYMPEIKRN